MSPTLNIPHEQTALSSGERATIRATLSASPNGRAHGHLAVATREQAQRYRAISGVLRPVDGERAEVAAVQMESQAVDEHGIGELVELTVRLRGTDHEQPRRADIMLERIPYGGIVVRCEARVEID